ncbi:autotransporter outer membrane beta-barrel domain-containing protein [Bartonella sp. HY406]|uniref:autotransporter family protein n=1 Tax=Bartonella sp. HY406 TaxID=2979331 RepID=UPI0021C81762|nr:autotransporter outer membrane beta-barrel domain-containing protein [Bartonella sp. HY406]UXN02797.1 autotransporter outer membrane beta-barrel domain-containing protein [Bartonella sp. HY406]
MKKFLLASTVLTGAFLFATNVQAAECLTASNGTFAIGTNGAPNQNSCSISSVNSTIGNDSIWAGGFGVYSGRTSNTMTIENDFSTTVKGSAGIIVYGGGGTTATQSVFDATGKTINLTLENLTANPQTGAGDRIAKVGLGVSHGGMATIGTLNLSMLNLPSGSGGGTWGVGDRYEHYGVLAGSTVNAGEPAAFNGMQSKAVFDNLNITMQSEQGGWLFTRYPLLAGIRVIQGAGQSSGNGAAGYVEVKNDLNINLTAQGNDAIGIYVSGTEKDGVRPEVRIHNSNITITSTSTRANALRIGKELTVAGTGEGLITSTGNMVLDTLNAPNSSAIAVVWQGGALNADADTASTTIKAGGQAITVSASTDIASVQSQTSFNNLVATTSSATANLIDVMGANVDYLLSVRGTNSNLTAADEGYILNMTGGSVTQPSTTVFNFADGKMTGLVNKGANTTLDLNVSNNAQWILAAKNGTTPSTTATFDQLNLTSGAQIIAYGASDGSANFTLQGNVLSDAGVLNLNSGVAGDSLTIKGNYTGRNNALLSIDTFLGESGALSDRLVIDGGQIDGNTLVRVNNVDATNAGGNTEPGQGIKIVRAINGGTTTDDAFALDATASNAYTLQGQTMVGAGAYAYGLFKGAQSSTVTEDEYGETELQNDWYLRSQLKPVEPPVEPPVKPPVKPEEPPVQPPVKPPVKPEEPPVKPPVDPVEPPILPAPPVFQAGVPTYEAYPQALLNLNSLPTLQQRVGNRIWISASNGSPVEINVENTGLWSRIVGNHSHFESQKSTSGVDFNQNIFKAQIGIDGKLYSNDHGSLISGINGFYTTGKTKTKSFYGDGEITTDGYGLGGTLTWYGNDGFYVDGQAQVTLYNSDLKSNLANRNLVSSNDGFGYALSAEAGKRFKLDEKWSITPQTQLVYSNIDFDSFHDIFNADVSLKRGDSLEARLGFAVDYETSWKNDQGSLNRTHIYGVGNLYYALRSGTSVDVSGVDVSNQQQRLWGSVGAGGSYNWNDDNYSIYGEALVKTSLSGFGDSYGVSGRIGFRKKW